MSREEALEFIESLPTSRAARRKRYHELGMDRAQQKMAEDHVRQLRLIQDAQRTLELQQAKGVFGDV